MARSSKYASVNFNDIYEKKITTNKPHSSSTSSSSSSSSSSPSPSLLTSNHKTILSNSRIHGNMLVLTRPTPKSISQSPSPITPSSPNQTRQEPENSISLRPQGRTGSSPQLLPSPLTSQIQIKDKEKDLGFSVSPKLDKFVPPHLRPGFVGREEKPEQQFPKQGNRVGHFAPLDLYTEERRPKSGGGQEKMRKEIKLDPAGVSRPDSSDVPEFKWMIRLTREVAIQ